MIEIFHDDSDKIKLLFYTAKLIRLCDDTPSLWKLNTEYLDALCFYMHICSHERLFEEKFLEGGIDITIGDSFCIGLHKYYPLIKI